MTHIRCGLSAFGLVAVIATTGHASASPSAVQTAHGSWSDGTTSGTSRTVVSESCTREYVCDIVAVADSRIFAPAWYGACTDTTASVGTRSVAAPFCRAVVTVRSLETSGPETCDATTLTGLTTGFFDFTTSDGVNIPVNNVDVAILNGVATIDGYHVDITGAVVGSVSAHFPVRCTTSTHHGGFTGTFNYVV